MDFRGHLRLPDDAGTGIPVVLRLDDIFVIISVGDEELGAWRADDVEIERIFSNQFAVDLAGEPMVFVAQDALGFAYEGITAIEELQARLTKRGIFRRSRKKDKQADSAVAELGDAQSGEAVPDEPAPAPPPSRRPAAELVSHLAHPEVADAVVPDLQPVPAPASSSLWTPANAKAAPSEEANPAEHVANALPTESRTRPASGERPADTRVSYPGASPPPPPAVEPFVPPAIPDAEPEPELEIESEPAAEPEPEPELEIEEVTAASSGVPWGDVDFEPQPEPAPEIEIEDYIPATAGEVDTFFAPQSVPEQVVTEPEVAPEIADVAEGPEEVPESAAEPEPDVPEDPSEPEAVTGIVEDRDHDEPIQSEVVAAQVARPTDEASSTNGHKAEKRRSFLFGRGRDKSVSAHDHTYGEPKTIGGLTRRVCNECGHVTFSGQDVYQEW